MRSDDRPRLIFHGAMVLLAGLLCGLPTAIEASNEAMLVWCLLAMGYGFMVALVMGGLLGTSPFKPGGTVPTFTAFVAAVIGIFGAVMATLVTLRGAHAAARGNPVD